MSDSVRFVQVTYRGLTVAARARQIDLGEGVVFVEHEAPMPVGTRLDVVADGGTVQKGRVVGVVEKEPSAKGPPGMRIAFGAESASPGGDGSRTQVMAGVEPPEGEAGAADTQVMAAVEPPEGEAGASDTIVMLAVAPPDDDGAADAGESARDGDESLGSRGSGDSGDSGGGPVPSGGRRRRRSRRR